MLRIRRNVTPAPSTEAPERPGPLAVGQPSTETPASAEVSKEEVLRLAQRRRELAELKLQLHRQLLERIDLTKFEKDSPDQRAQIRKVLVDLVGRDNRVMDSRLRDRLVSEVLDETFGLGPLEEILSDPTVTDILVNGPRQVYVERKGQLTLTNVTFRDNDHLLQIIDRIVSSVGRRIDETCPMVDARLADGSRVNAIIPPLAIDGPAVSIRRFGVSPIKIEDLISYGSIIPEMVHFCAAAVRAKMNILIVGGTGSGKTTLLNTLSSFIPENERVVTIEDAAELQLQQTHVVRLETRPPNIEGRGEITARELVRNSLRMRPDRIIVGEVRGGEALDMLQAMNTGHEGSMTTIHANTTRDAIARLETMVGMAGLDLPNRAIRQQFASAINLIIQVQRLTGGPRRVVRIAEVLGMEGETITMQDLFLYEQVGLDQQHRAVGRFVATGIRSRYIERMISMGLDISPSMFERRVLRSDVPGENNNGRH
ncbi:MAG: hypothetical protein HJJLKODD_01008 [Phycisphaerae bacterium]|nr:hypothetical protein [Phycisphaerae bacterium]